MKKYNTQPIAKLMDKSINSLKKLIPFDDIPFLSFEDAVEKKMTLADVVRHYIPDASDNTVNKAVINAEQDCALKMMHHPSPSSKELVNAIYYTIRTLIN